MSTSSEPFVERVISVDGQDTKCRFFRPQPEDSSFFCRFEIEWPGGTRSKSVGGVDQVQALLLAMCVAHTDLLSAREKDGRNILWMDERSLGLPITDCIRDWDVENRF